MEIAIKGCFVDPLLEVMNFLNEVVMRYPQAISFAPGRPAERHFDVEGSLARVARWVDDRAEASGRPAAAVYAELGQYSRTKGIIHELIARQIELDQGIVAAAESIVVTSGCQEGMAILLAALFEPATDVLLVSDPTYIGITGLARVLGIPIVPIPSGPQGLEPAAVAAAAADIALSGRRARALYDVPDFNNPLGTCLSLAARHELLAVAEACNLLIFEDNAYGMFRYDGDPLPALKALDQRAAVVYMGSFSKTLFPSLRLGFLVADQQVALIDGRRSTLAEELSKVKSLTTVNTSAVLQAVAGGLLLDHHGSLAVLVREKLAFYRANRDAMLHCLETELTGLATWNHPQGGFFLTVDLPFAFDRGCLEECAREFGVICCPMTFFSLTKGRERQVRLSFSSVTLEQIAEGVARLARFVRQRSERSAGPSDVGG